MWRENSKRLWRNIAISLTTGRSAVPSRVEYCLTRDEVEGMIARDEDGDPKMTTLQIPDFFPEQVPIWVKVLAGIALAFGGVANAFVYSVVNDLNRQKPEGRKNSYYFWYPGKMLRIFREHEQQFPASRKTTWFNFFIWRTPTQ